MRRPSSCACSSSPGGTLVETADGYGGGIAQDVLAGLLRRAVSRDDLVIAGPQPARRRPARRRRRARGAAGRAGPAAAPAGHRLPRPVAAARLGSGRPAGRDARRRRRGGDVRAGALRGARRAGGLAARHGGRAGPRAVAARRRRPRCRPSTPCSPAHAEAELLPAAAHHGAGLLAWAPLGRGVLTGTYADAPAVSPYVEERRTERAARIVQAVLTAAEGLGHVAAGRGPGLGARPARASPRRWSGPATPRSWGRRWRPRR